MKKFLLYITWIISSFQSPDSFSLAIEQHLIKDIRVLGAERTQKEWIIEYLDLFFPMVISDAKVQFYSEKLMTTGVFKDVEIYFDQVDHNKREKTLVIKIEEKWTTIPVIRGEFGGGTPLKVIGIYDTHSFGKLWTLGAEARKYGDAAPGYVLWAHAPRWKKGNHALGVEYWRDRRIRSIYNQGEVASKLNTDLTKFRLLAMFPVTKNFEDRLLDFVQLGISYENITEHEVSYEFSNKQTSNFSQSNTALNRENHLLARVVFDNVKANDLYMDGLRFINQYGLLLNDSGQNEFYSGEAFYFLLLSENINLANHLYIQNSNSQLLSSNFYLGGLDSVRGFPDGFVSGNKAIYANLELRYIGLKFKHILLQQVLFYDQGAAGYSLSEVKSHVIASAGVGIRVSIPKVYRLMLRIDYGWGLRDNKTRGLTIGLNQFFQPYKPL